MNSHVNSYKDLIFWQKSYSLARQIIVLTRQLPKDQITYVLIKQIIRSATSIGANIAEGYGRYKGKEYERFLQIALGSAQETEYWLELIKDEYPNSNNNYQELINLCGEIIRMLSKSLGSLRSSTKH